MPETIMIDGTEYPRHPSHPVGRETDAARLRKMLEAVNYARTHCTTRERPLHLSLVQCEATIRRLLTAASPTPLSLDAKLPWESEADRGG